MLRVVISVEPGGDPSMARAVSTVEIANVSADPTRSTQDYAWRLRDPSRDVDACGYALDVRPLSAADVLWRCLAEWRSGRAAAVDQHGVSRLPEGADLGAAEFWERVDGSGDAPSAGFDIGAAP